MSLARILFSARLWKLVLALAAFVFTLTVAAWLVLGPFLRWRMQTAASDTLGVPVTVEEAGIDILRCVAWGKGIVVASPPGFTEPYVVRIGRVEIEISPISWLAGSVDMEGIEAWDTDLRIEILEKGTNTSFLSGKAPAGDAQKPARPLFLGNCVFHNASVTVADRDKPRIAFIKAEIEFENPAFFKGISHPTRVRATSLLQGQRSSTPLRVSGTVGPTGDFVNFDLSVDVKRLDLRDFRMYFDSDPSSVFGSHHVHVSGRIVCRQNMLAGTSLVARSSTGEMYPITLAGTIDSPRLSAGAKIVNTINLPLQKIFRFIRKITIVFD